MKIFSKVAETFSNIQSSFRKEEIVVEQEMAGKYTISFQKMQKRKSRVFETKIKRNGKEYISIREEEKEFGPVLIPSYIFFNLKDGHDYLMWNDQMKNLVVVQLTTGKVVKKENYRPIVQEKNLSPDRQIIVQETCSETNDVIFLDISAPLMLPYKILYIFKDAKFVKWDELGVAHIRTQDRMMTWKRK